MAESFDVFRYTSYILSRGQWIATSCVVAVALALAVSLAIERQYTAITQIIIEPPAGSDLRAAMTVSPIYLESLKTYEHFAAGDRLFQQATGEFQLRAQFGARPIETIKNRILRVGIVRNTRILEIAVTLPDAAKALAMARYLAQATVDLNRTMVVEGDQDLVEGIARQERDARASLTAVDAAWAHLLAEEPVDALQGAMSQAGNLRSTVQQQMQSTELEIADSAERQKHLTDAQQTDARQEAADASARLEEMRKQLQAIDRQNAEREKLLALRMAHPPQTSKRHAPKHASRGPAPWSQRAEMGPQRPRKAPQQQPPPRARSPPLAQILNQTATAEVPPLSLHGARWA